MSSSWVVSPDAARRLRLRAQGLSPRGELEPVEVVRRMVALQGQDLPAVLRAIAVRCRPGTTIAQVRAAFDAGLLVRGWTQRGTLFATTPTDLAALMSLTAERVRRRSRTIREGEGLDDDVVRHATAVARDVLADGAVSRATLTDAWQQDGVPTEKQRGYHLIVTLALDGVLHWGPFAGSQQLLVGARGAGPAPGADGDPAGVLRRVARAYFATHGPATVDDLAWWLGLPKTPVRAAVAELRAQDDRTDGSRDGGARDGSRNGGAQQRGPGARRDVLVDVEVAGTPMLATRGGLGLEDGREPAGEHLPSPPPCGVVLVPGFDEIVLGYQDRGLVASEEAMRTVVPFSNGVFRPAVLLDGRLVGTWRRARSTSEPPFTLVGGLSARDRRAVEKARAAWKHD